MNDATLPQNQLLVAVALTSGPRHGLGIKKVIEDDTNGAISLGSGALYGALKQLLTMEVIEEVPANDTARGKRHYRLTYKGWKIVAHSVELYSNVITSAKKRGVLNR